MFNSEKVVSIPGNASVILGFCVSVTDQMSGLWFLSQWLICWYDQGVRVRGAGGPHHQLTQMKFSISEEEDLDDVGGGEEEIQHTSPIDSMI